jgi:hypothetical protein
VRRRYDLSQLNIYVSEHVIDQSEERLGYRPRFEDIRQEAFDAIFHGRWSPETPPWLNVRNAQGNPRSVFAWPEDESYAFVIEWGGANSLRIVTVVLPQHRDERMRDQLRAWLRANEGEDAA